MSAITYELHDDRLLWLPPRVRLALRGIEYRSRLAGRAFVPGRRLHPSLVVIGALKGGTTSLFEALARHPGVAAPLVKEVHYFDLNWHHRRAWYWRHFPRAASARGRVTMEASPGYLVHPEAAARAHRVIPEARIAVLLRHPVERAISHYFHERLLGRERRDLEEALESEASDTAPSAALRVRGGRLLPRYYHEAYVACGRYADQLRPWFETFGRDRVLVLFTEEFFNHPRAVVDRVCAFAELPPARVHVDVHNLGGLPSRSRALAINLWHRYRDSNAELAELLGRPLPWTAP
jgi:hypothetical protein